MNRRNVQIIIIGVFMTSLAIIWFVANVDMIGSRPLRIIWGHDPEMFDPHLTSNPIAYEIFRHVCEPLFYTDEQGDLHGLLATDHIQFHDAGKTMVITIRANIFFHDGSPLTAESVVESFTHLQRSGYSPLLNDLRGVKIVAKDDRVFFTLPEIDYEFTRLVLTSYYASITKENPVSDLMPFCTGPYQYVPDLYKAGTSLTTWRFDQYNWSPNYFVNRGSVAIPEITFLFIDDKEERYASLIAGEACMLSLSSQHLERAQVDATLTLYEATGGITYLGFNFARMRWQDDAVRRAIAGAIDKDTLQQIGPYQTAEGPLTQVMLGYDPATHFQLTSYNPAQSRAVLEAAHVDFADELVILIPESDIYDELAELITNQLRDIGFANVRIRSVSRPDLLTIRQDYDLLIFDYAWGSYIDMASFLGTGTRNLLSYPENDITSLVQTARMTEDIGERNRLIREAQVQILSKVIYEPLIVRELTIAINHTCVIGETFTRDGLLQFHDAQTDR